MSSTKAPLEQELDKVTEQSSESEGKIKVQVGDTVITFDYKTKSDKNISDVIAYTAGNKLKLEAGNLISTLSTDFANLLPEGLRSQPITFANLLVIYTKDKSTKTTKWLLGLDISLGEDLSFGRLPFVGEGLPDAIANIKLEPSLRIVGASKSFDLKEIRKFNESLPDEINKLPDPGEEDEQAKETAISFRKGFSLSGSLGLPNTPALLPTNALNSNSENNSAGSNTGGQTTPNLTGIWFDIDKSYGPFFLKQVGLQYGEKNKIGELSVLFDAGLKISEFTLSCDDLTVTFPLSGTPIPSFSLAGVGIEFKAKNFEIAGALLHSKKEKDGIAYDEYVGTAMIKLQLSGKGGKAGKGLGLSAIGSYAYYNGQPAIFFYAVLDFPLGGPPYFFVTGLALGFGYNRYLKVPSIDKLTEFPLVAQAMGDVSKDDLSETGEMITEQLGKLDKYVTLSPGSGFIAVGIKFTSFKMVDCFALLTIALGEGFEINLLGIAPRNTRGRRGRNHPYCRSDNGSESEIFPR